MSVYVCTNETNHPNSTVSRGVGHEILGAGPIVEVDGVAAPPRPASWRYRCTPASVAAMRAAR